MEEYYPITLIDRDTASLTKEYERIAAGYSPRTAEMDAALAVISGRLIQLEETKNILISLGIVTKIPFSFDDGRKCPT